MKDRNNGAVYFILGVLVVAVLVIGYFVIDGDRDAAPVVVTQSDSGNDSGQADTSNDDNVDNADTSDGSGSSFDLTIGDDGVSVSTETNN